MLNSDAMLRFRVYSVSPCLLLPCHFLVILNEMLSFNANVRASTKITMFPPYGQDSAIVHAGHAIVSIDAHPPVPDSHDVVASFTHIVSPFSRYLIMFCYISG